MIEADSQGRLITRSQVTDYQYRGHALAGQNLVTFYMNTYEISTPKNTADGIMSEGAPLADDAGDGVEVDEGETHGTGRSLRVAYLDGHPKAGSVLRVVRHQGHNTLPDFLGYHTFPRNDDPETIDFYYAAMLMLFKPWRSLIDLQSGHSSWQGAFAEFIQSTTDWTRRMLSNIEHYHRCKRAAEEDRDVADDEQVRGDVERGQADMEVDEVGDGSEGLGVRIQVTEEMIERARAQQTRLVDRVHGRVAVEIGESVGLFRPVDTTWRPTARTAIGDDMSRLVGWRAALSQQAMERGAVVTEVIPADAQRHPDVVPLDASLDASVEPAGARGDVVHLESEAAIDAINVDRLKPDQLRAFEIINWHLGETIAGRDVPQLLMQIQGEGGTGKSLVVQTVTQVFEAKGQRGLLLKGAYTGIAASLVDGKTTHVLGLISLRGGDLSEDGKKKLAEMFRGVQYLILDESSMLSRAFFAKLSRHISIGKTGGTDSDKPFGGINVVLCGDFHQFPPVAQKKSAPLYYDTQPGISESVDEALGREIYKQFTVVVRLTEQVRVSDPVWTSFLRHLRDG